MTYVIVASNSGPGNVTGATVTDTFSSNLTSITWSCAGSGGASCTANGAGNINDTSVNLPVGTSITYTVNATVISSPSGTLDNTATVAVPIGVTDPVPGNNSASDIPSDQLIVPNPPGNIGPSPDGSVTTISSPTFITLQLGSPLIVSSPDGYDLVYYPDPAAPTLQVDWVILQISDGSNWYTIFNWGNGSPDTNTDVPYPMCAAETDNCVIDTSSSANPPGISIDVDGIVPIGTYSYIRIFSPVDSGDGVAVDAIQVLP